MNKLFNLGINQKILRKACILLASFSLIGGIKNPSLAQQIIPNADGTMTVVTQDGNRFDISGGSLSGDGRNLFHSFQEFGLNANQIANFLSNPNIQNILTRVNGGNPSIINGLLQISGGNSNLFILNPNGVIFGPNASLNIPGAFTATTATGISFGDGIFSAFGDNNFTSLVGNPNGFIFDSLSPGVIINEADLSVNPGENISLIGGTVINTGTIETPGGRITIAAIPDTNRVRISQEGQILSLELEITPNESLTSLDLPRLLTGGENSESTLQASTESNLSGLNLVSGNLDVSDFAIGGEINLWGARVGGIDANLNATGFNGGGIVLIGGDFRGEGIGFNAFTTLVNSNSIINADALENGNGGLVVLWADGNTIFNGYITARGGIDNGNGGLVEVSGKENLSFQGEINADGRSPGSNPGTVLLDPENIIIVDVDSALDDSELEDGEILAGDSPESTFTISVFALEALTGDNNVILEATNDITIVDLNTELSNDNITFATGSGSITFNADADTDGNGVFQMEGANDTIIAPGRNLTIQGESVILGNIDLSINPDDVDNLADNGGNLTVNLTSLDSSNPGNIEINGGIIDTNGSQIFNGDLVLNTNTEFTTGGGFESQNITGDGVDLNINGNSIITEDINLSSGIESQSEIVNGGNLLIDGESIITGDIDTSSISGNGGNVTLESSLESENSISTGNINTNSQIGNSGEVVITGDSISTGEINTSSDSGNGGEVTIESPLETEDFIFTGNIDTSSESGNAGNVTLGLPSDSEIINPIPENNIQTGFINSVGGAGGGEIIVITPGFFQVIDSFQFADSSVSIASLITETEGGITITHGGNGETEFEVGNPIINGTEGEIISGDETIIDEAFLFTQIIGNISIISVDAPVSPPIDVPESSPIDILDEISNPTDTEASSVTPIATGLETSFNISSVSQIRKILTTIQKESGVKPAVVYVSFARTGIDPEAEIIRQEAQLSQEYRKFLTLPNEEGQLALPIPPSDDDELELILVTPDQEEATRIRISGVTRKEVVEEARNLYVEVSNLGDFQPHSEQLYEWLLAELEVSLEEADIKNLLFIMPPKLRLIPIAALYDKKTDQFFAQKYSTGFAPSISLMDTRYRDISNFSVLALGASTFEESQNQSNLPAVPVELDLITTELRNGESLLNEEFTYENFLEARQENPFPIIHLATHADFQEGDASDIYIQLYDSRLQLNQLRELGLNQPTVELLVISACRSAFGDEEAELGFGGLAVQAGVKSAIASLWYVGDTGTLALMNGIYTQLNTAKIKAEALRQAQIDMIEGNVTKVDGKIITSQGAIDLPPESGAFEEDLSHPFYWAPFTIIGSPW